MSNSKELKISLCGRLTAENSPETLEKNNGLNGRRNTVKNYG